MSLCIQCVAFKVNVEEFVEYVTLSISSYATHWISDTSQRLLQ